MSEKNEWEKPETYFQMGETATSMIQAWAKLKGKKIDPKVFALAVEAIGTVVKTQLMMIQGMAAMQKQMARMLAVTEGTIKMQSAMVDQMESSAGVKTFKPIERQPPSTSKRRNPTRPV